MTLINSTSSSITSRAAANATDSTTNTVMPLSAVQPSEARTSLSAHQGAMEAPSVNRHLPEIAEAIAAEVPAQDPFQLNQDTLTAWSDNNVGGNDQTRILKSRFCMDLFHMPGQDPKKIHIPGVTDDRIEETLKAHFKTSSLRHQRGVMVPHLSKLQLGKVNSSVCRY